MDYWAYYYDWWGSSSWASVTDMPELGFYLSSNPSVVRQHIQWAKQCGIVGFITTFWEGILNSLDVLTTIAEEENFKLGIITEFLDMTLAERDRQLGVFFARYGNRTPYKSWGGKTPIVFWASWQFTGPEWDSILAKYRSRAVLLCCENSWDTGTGYIAKMAYFDGNAPYTATMVERYPERFQAMSQECRNLGKIFFCPMGPGQTTPTTVVPREYGEFYKRNNATTRGLNPTAIGIISWNEFYEDTHIEPSANYGHLYLDLTASFTAKGTYFFNHWEDTGLSDNPRQINT